MPETPIDRVVSWLTGTTQSTQGEPTKDILQLTRELDETLGRLHDLEEHLRELQTRAGKDRKSFMEQRDKAREQRDKSREQRDGLEQRLRDEKAHAKKLTADFERVVAQRDQARRQRDEARLQRDELMLAGGKLTRYMKQVQDLHKQWPKRHFRIGDHIDGFFERHGLASGAVLEIGGRDNPYRERFSRFDYTNLDLGETGEGVLIGDITSCPEIAEASFDAVISVDVFEHIDRPWLAAKEITRLLKPGGITYHSTLFSWRYHPCPIDYWRFSPEALRSLFGELEHIDAGFDDSERRRNILGSGATRVEPDAFGGWRENWRVFYAGKKLTT